MKKLFELTPEDAKILSDNPDGAKAFWFFTGEQMGFKPDTVEIISDTQFFAQTVVKDLAPPPLGSEMNVESFTALQLSKFEYRVVDLQKKAEEYSSIVVTGIDDKEGRKKLTRARIDAKGDIAGIRKVGKGLREFSNSYNKQVIQREDELAGILEPVRDALQKRENELDEEEERIRAEEERKEDQRIQDMIDKLAAVGHAADYALIKGLTDEAFEEMLTEAINIHNEKVKRDQEEADRLRLEKDKAERERQEESVRLDKQRKQQDEENKKIAAQQEQIREQQEKIRLDKEKMEAEKRKMAEQKLYMRKNRLLALGMEISDNFRDLRFRTKDKAESIYVLVGDIEPLEEEAFDKFVIDTESFIQTAVKKYQEREIQFQAEQEKKIKADQEAAVQKALKEKEEREKKAKEEAEEKAAAASDHDKLVALAEAIDNIFLPECKSKYGQRIVIKAREVLNATSEVIKEEMFKEGQNVL